MLYVKKYFGLEFRSVILSFNFYLKFDNSFLKEFSKMFSKFAVYVKCTAEAYKDCFLSLVVTDLTEFMERKIGLFGQIYFLVIHQI